MAYTTSIRQTSADIKKDKALAGAGVPLAYAVRHIELGAVLVKMLLSRRRRKPFSACQSGGRKLIASSTTSAS